MAKETLQQKIKRVLRRFTPGRIAIIMLGTAILSFGIHNIHQRTAITEGGIIGLVLLINHWLGVPASVASPLLDAASYALAFKFLGWDFLLSAGIASVSLAGFYRLWGGTFCSRQGWPAWAWPGSIGSGNACPRCCPT